MRSDPDGSSVHHRDVLAFAASLPRMGPHPVAVIGASLDLGAGRRGVDMGPSAIRYAGLGARIRGLGRGYHDHGNVEGSVVEIAEQGSADARYVDDIVAVCSRVSDEVAASVASGALPLVLGGDHSVALGTHGGLARADGHGGVVWIDAHGDLNTPESSPSGNAWGMPLRMLIDAGDVAASDVTLLEARNLDPPEVEFIAQAGIRLELGELPETIYVAIDCDAVDPVDLDVWMPEPDGIRLAALEALLASLPRPAGAGITGAVVSERNEAALARLGHALGL